MTLVDSLPAFERHVHDLLAAAAAPNRDNVLAAAAVFESIHDFVAIDRDSSSMVNVSVWRSLADAQQMQTLAPMLALAEEFTREGVRFERPVINYETLCISIDSGAASGLTARWSRHAAMLF